ncbi:MAG: hypothetical protein ACFFEF_12410 [Candidatus Thorarchaeota archaeon]
MRRLIDTLKDESVDLMLLHCPSQLIEARNLYDKYDFEVRAYAMKKHLRDINLA